MRSVPLEQVGETVRRHTREVTPHLWMLPVIGLFVLVVYAWTLDSWKALPVAAGIGAAAVAFGAFIGFLFGIPRTLTSEAPARQQADGQAGDEVSIRSNTNLEQISDWLTKIIVGVGLVELGRIRASIGDLVDYLAPSLGTQASAKPFTLAILVYFSVVGFIAGYILTRIVLLQEFALAERDIAAVAGRVVAEVVESRDEADANALRLLTQQLEPREDPVDQEALNKAVAAATQVAKQLMFNRARQQRREGWKANNKEAVERTIPVFRALISDDEKKAYHRNHGELAFALKDQPTSDPAEAEKELDEAIRIRDARGHSGYEIYEFNRALCRIAQDADFAAGQASSAEQRERILSDLTVAIRSRRVKALVVADPSIDRWGPLQQPPVDVSAM